MTVKKVLKNQGGFTLIEMLIVVAIIAILVAISIPMINKSLENARNSTDLANERAAKTAVLLEYTEKGYIGESAAATDTLYYSAVNGNINKTKPTPGYGKSTSQPTGSLAEAVTGSLKDKVLEVSLDTTTLEVTLKWVD